MGRDRNIAIGFGSTYAAATIIRSVKRASLSLSNIPRSKKTVIELKGTKIGAFPSYHLNDAMYLLPNYEKYTHIDAALLVLTMYYVSFLFFSS